MHSTGKTIIQTTNPFQRIKKLALKHKIHLFCVLLASVSLSSFQGKTLSVRDKTNEKHLEIFTAQFQNIQKGFHSASDSGMAKMVASLYAQNGKNPLWTINYSLNQNAIELLRLLSQAHTFGLDSGRFETGKLRDLGHRLKKEKNYIELSKIRLDLELAYTQNALRFIASLNKGMLFERSFGYCPSSIYGKWLVDQLILCANDGSFATTVKASQPHNFQYERLQKGLEVFVSVINPGHFILGNHDMDTVAAKFLLKGLGLLPEMQNDSVFSISLKKFQKYYGLEQTGSLNRSTLDLMQQVANEQYKKISLNLERLRLEEWGNDNYIFVNIPSFQLRIIENNREMASMRTVIGKPVTPTPEFSAKIEKIVTHPSWFVPRSISSKELLQKAKQDTGYLERNNYLVFDKESNPVPPAAVDWQSITTESFDYRLIQKSSAGNALGSVKFLFPNTYSVYVHDTPAKKLFDNNYRAYSHGCVRLENPHYLAEYLIRKQSAVHLEKKLKDNLDKGIQEIFQLKNQIDIHLRYYTVEADEAGTLSFFTDIYGKDKMLMEQLFPTKEAMPLLSSIQ
jgi:L,D-transpeptidase YcbB